MAINEPHRAVGLLAMVILGACGGGEPRAAEPRNEPAGSCDVLPPVAPAPAIAPVIAAAPADACHRRETLERFIESRSSHDFWLPDAAQVRYRAKWVDAELERLAPGDRVVELATEATQHVKAALAKRDYAGLAKLVHSRGLCVMAAKGAGCRWIPAAELARCATATRKEAWAFDDGRDSPPKLTCNEALQQIAFDRDYAAVKPKVNCFPEHARGNNASSIINPEVPTDFYVELYVPERDGPPGTWQAWKALWLHFAIEDIDPKLVGITSEHWGI
jgi:hypothetical protein